MRKQTLVALVTCIILTAFLTVSQLTAQTRAVPSGGGSDAGRAIAPSVSTSVSTSASSDSSGVGYSSVAGRASDYSPATFSPSIQGTSFNTVTLYNSWGDYYSYLYHYYNVYPFYFNRFYRNQEPLMTPAMLKLTLRQPLILSTVMLKSIDELESMLADARDGKSVDKKAIVAKAEAIRNLAKEIRQDRTLSIVDIRKETVLFKDDNIDMLNPEAIAKLREMALDLNRQLKNLFSESSTSTVSVDSYKEPSFESVTKGIEKACKAIEHSSKSL